MSALDDALAVADAVLYEGYVLYPYRASAGKNQVRWQWGVLMPPDVVELDASERSGNLTEVVVDGTPRSLTAHVRFLQVQARSLQDADGAPVDRLETEDAVYLPFDEARSHDLVLPIPLDGRAVHVEAVPGEEWTEEVGPGRLVRHCEPLVVTVTSEVREIPGPYPARVLSLRVENTTAPGTQPGSTRPEWLRRALAACHVVLEVDGAAFVSPTDPPEWAGVLVGECASDGLVPVLAGPAGQDRLVLSSPIILYDHAEVAPQSRSAFFDALEIDELLSLRTLTLSEEEKREARGTDPRVAALLGEVDDMPPELWDRLHGAVSDLDPPGEQDVPWWDPGSDASVDPENDAVLVGDVEVRRGARVLLRPGVRRADAYDLFLAGRAATVAAVLHDVDGHQHLAVTVDEDPGAELMTAHGRYLYFAPDEVEPLRVEPSRAGGSEAVP